MVDLKKKKDDFLNRKFGRLKVISRIGLYKGKNSIYHCECRCGNTVDILRQSLLSGATTSCGCLKKEMDTQLHDKAGFLDGTCISIIKSNKVGKTNTSGIKGVSWDKSRNKWLAQIFFQGKHYHLEI